MTGIAIKARGVDMDDNARAQIIQHGQSLFSRVNFWVRQIELILDKHQSDEGEHIKCTVRVVGQDGSAMVLEHVQANMPGAAITGLRRAYHKFSQMKYGNVRLLGVNRVTKKKISIHIYTHSFVWNLL